MSPIYHFPDLSLGALEREVLSVLWEESPLKPSDVHARVAGDRGITVNTVSSALKRLFEKNLLVREKVSHSYVYSPGISRIELQRQLINSVATQFGAESGAGVLAAFVDLTEKRGVDALKRLESMIADRLRETEE